MESKLRPMTCELNVLTKPDGSAAYTQGRTVAMAAVYGPSEARHQKEQPDKAYLEVIYKPRIGLPGTSERVAEHVIKNTCEVAILKAFHPRTAISLIIQEIQDDGGFLATVINASCLALMNASIPMDFLVAAVTCIVSKDGKVIIDPEQSQIDDGYQASATFVFNSVDYDLIMTRTEGKLSDTQLLDCVKACREASKTIFDFYRKAVKRLMSKDELQ